MLGSLPSKREVFRKVLISEHIYDYLNILADHKDFVMQRIDENDLSLFKSQQKWNPNEERKRKEGNDNNDGDEEENEDYDYDYFEPKSTETLFYGYYMYNIANNHYGTKIHKFNSLFKDDSGLYALDELVNVLSIDQIKKLNDRGYVIGKYVFLSGYNSASIGWLNPINQITHKNMKEFITKN